jgi:hypothetical protein
LKVLYSEEEPEFLCDHVWEIQSSTLLATDMLGQRCLHILASVLWCISVTNLPLISLPFYFGLLRTVSLRTS